MYTDIIKRGGCKLKSELIRVCSNSIGSSKHHNLHILLIYLARWLLLEIWVWWHVDVNSIFLNSSYVGKINPFPLITLHGLKTLEKSPLIFKKTLTCTCRRFLHFYWHCRFRRENNNKVNTEGGVLPKLVADNILFNQINIFIKILITSRLRTKVGNPFGIQNVCNC